MGYKERQKLYQDLRDIRGNHVIAYVTSLRPNIPVNMGRDVIDYIIKQIKQVPDEINEIDFLIISNGGDPIVALRVIGLLRERFEKINVLIPSVAYSAATVLSLGADKIVMHPYSHLGPVDPQITTKKQNPDGRDSYLRFSTEDISNYIDFFKEDASIKSEKYLTEIMKLLITDVSPIVIGLAKRSQKLSISLAEKLLSTHLKKPKEASRIANQLNSSYYHHGYTLSRDEAREIGLKIEDSNKKTEEILWKIWEDVSDEMKCEQPFDIVSEVMSDKVLNKKINSIPYIDIPSNTPEIIKEEIWKSVISNIQTTTANHVERNLNVAVIESEKIAFELIVYYNIIVWRDANFNLQFNVNQHTKGWEEK